MGTIFTLGEILVEIMAIERGQSFREPGRLVVPYPSGYRVRSPDGDWAHSPAGTSSADQLSST